MLRLVDLNLKNFLELIELTVSKEQENFVASNLFSIAQSKVQPECIPLGIYDDDTPVGFLMYCLDADDEEYWIYRLMIDTKYQSRGYGREAMKLIID